ncbi:hypothetical protein EV202_1205 [Bacteroides heparinolyticus]|uniref:IncA protein n=1 Tax=Prevotella heparinolytica TaxID=28113 RepID=A0A4R2LHE3_9BACE|nr:hypothetical protein [Bacteroides heparinolyticus]TCO89470.1 hypothetical protein EV202_1205 [Bacteroides heparinolyticus]
MLAIISSFIIGGAIGITMKDKLFGSESQKEDKQREVDSLYAENEKFSKRNKEMKRQIEDLLSELNKVRKQAKIHDDENENLEDDLDKAKKELKDLRLQNEELVCKLKEYRTACEMQEIEITKLKEGMNI